MDKVREVLKESKIKLIVSQTIKRDVVCTGTKGAGLTSGRLMFKWTVGQGKSLIIRNGENGRKGYHVHSFKFQEKGQGINLMNK